MSPEGGFYYDGVKQIEQDKLGFIWVMMENELYRFDGYQYKKYRPYFNNLMPGLLQISVLFVYYLLISKKNVSIVKLVLGTLVVALVLAFFGIV